MEKKRQNTNGEDPGINSQTKPDGVSLKGVKSG